MMFRNFFKTAVRNLSKNRFFTVLNVIGLALGMSLSLLFIALLTFLSRFDDFHSNGDRIYRVTTQLYDKQENPRFASAPAGLAQNLTDFAGVEKVVRIHRSLNGKAVYGEKKIGLYGYFADSSFFEIFNYPLLEGDKATALDNPNSIVLSATEATKIFGAKDAMGEIIDIEGYGTFLVTGIFKDLPENTHMEFGAIASYTTFDSNKKATSLDNKDGWRSFRGSFVYMLLSKDADLSNIQHLLNGIAKERYAQQNIKAAFKIQSLDKIVPGPELWDSIGPNWSYLFLFITWF